MRAEFRSRLPKIAEYADALGVRFVHILAGPCAPAQFFRFGDVVPALLNSGYDGWLGAEYHPTGHTEAGLGWLVQWRQQAKLVSCRGTLAPAL